MDKLHWAGDKTTPIMKPLNLLPGGKSWLEDGGSYKKTVNTEVF